jgi:hypothetical protein
MLAILALVVAIAASVFALAAVMQAAASAVGLGGRPFRRALVAAAALVGAGLLCARGAAYAQTQALFSPGARSLLLAACWLGAAWAWLKHVYACGWVAALRLLATLLGLALLLPLVLAVHAGAMVGAVEPRPWLRSLLMAALTAAAYAAAIWAGPWLWEINHGLLLVVLLIPPLLLWPAAKQIYGTSWIKALVTVVVAELVAGVGLLTVARMGRSGFGF